MSRPEPITRCDMPLLKMPSRIMEKQYQFPITAHIAHVAELVKIGQIA